MAAAKNLVAIPHSVALGSPEEARLLALMQAHGRDSAEILAAGELWQLACLRARGHDVDLALPLLERYMEWRRSNAVDEFRGAPELRTQLRTGFIRCCGNVDLEGRIVVHVDNSKHNPNLWNARSTVLAVHAVLEYALFRYPAAQKFGFAVLQDLSHIKMANVDLAVPKALKDAFADTFPLRVRAVYIYQAPLFVRVIAPVLKAFLSSKMRKRIILVNKGSIDQVHPSCFTSRLHMHAQETIGTTVVHVYLQWPQQQRIISYNCMQNAFKPMHVPALSIALPRRPISNVAFPIYSDP